MLMGLGDLVGRGGAEGGFRGGAWDSGGQDGEGVWAYGGDGGGSDVENTECSEEDQSQQGLPMKEAAWSRASTFQGPEQEVKGAVNSTSCRCRTCVLHLFWGLCGSLLEVWADVRSEVSYIEEAFEQYVRVCARPAMHYYYYYY